MDRQLVLYFCEKMSLEKGRVTYQWISQKNFEVELVLLQLIQQ